MTRPLLVLAIPALLVVAGCVKKPPEPAEIRKEAIPQVTEERAWAGAATAGDVTAGWLASFHDQQLDALVREAIANNPDLRVGATRVEQAAIAVTLAKSRLYPSIGILGRGSTKLSDDLSAGLSGGIFSVSWEIDLWGKLRYARNAASETFVASQWDFEFARQSIAAETAKGWFTAAATLLERDLVAEMVSAAQERVTLADKRVKVGAGDEQDTADARADVAGYEEERTQVMLSHEQSLRALELILGRYPSAELAARSSLPQFPGPVPAGLPLGLLERRPDIIAAERRVAAAFNRVGEAKAARLPTLSLTLSGGYLTSSVLQLKDDYENPSAGLSGSLFVPLFKGGALKGQVELRTAEQRQAVAEYTRLAWRAIGDVENALAGERALVEREGFLRASVTERQRALALEETAYRIGRTDNRAVLSRKLAAVSAQAAVLRLLAARLSQRVDLYLALGGGWDVPPAPAAEAGTR
jgi:multidrug efflux system outer membrane protein